MILSNIDVLMSYYISTVDKGYIHESVSVIRCPGRGISISGRSIITIRGPGRGISIAIAGRGISIGAYPS